MQKYISYFSLILFLSCFDGTLTAMEPAPRSLGEALFESGALDAQIEKEVAALVAQGVPPADLMIRLGILHGEELRALDAQRKRSDSHAKAEQEHLRSVVAHLLNRPFNESIPDTDDALSDFRNQAVNVHNILLFVSEIKNKQAKEFHDLLHILNHESDKLFDSMYDRLSTLEERINQPCFYRLLETSKRVHKQGIYDVEFRDSVTALYKAARKAYKLSSKMREEELKKEKREARQYLKIMRWSLKYQVRNQPPAVAKPN